MELEQFVSTPLAEEQGYHNFYRFIFGDFSLEYPRIVNFWISKASKNLVTIRKEILYAEQNKTLKTEEGETLALDLGDMGIDEGIKKYFEAWRLHDSFAYEIARNMLERITNCADRNQTMSQFISNDQLIRVYVSENLPHILSNLQRQIRSQGGIDFVPALSSFEFYLIGEAEKARAQGVENFANAFTYGDLGVAEQEVKRLFNPAARDVYQKIRDKKVKDQEKSQEVLENLIKNGVDRTLLHRFIRLSHWAGFEEPRKRYKIEGGIVDYLFRELVFQQVKKDSNGSLFGSADFCLQLNQKQFLDYLGEKSNV